MRALAPCVVVVLAIGCTAVSEIPWDVRVGDEVLASRAAAVETSIRRGGCDGVPVYRASIARGRRGPPPALGRGLHGFAAEARDAECQTIARACVERDLPLPPGARVELVLEATTAAPIDGGIDPRDGGTLAPDAGSAAPDAGACGGATFGARCYVLHPEGREWSAAEAVCAAEHGHLTSLGGPEEASFVRALAGPDRYWIGLNDLAAEGVWQWADASTSSHRDWAGGSQRNREQDDCVYDTPGEGWSVARCREVHAFVCER